MTRANPKLHCCHYPRQFIWIDLGHRKWPSIFFTLVPDTTYHVLELLVLLPSVIATYLEYYYLKP